MVNEVQILVSILKEALEKKASDIIISTDSHPSLKINWEIVFLIDYWVFTNEQFKDFVSNIMTRKQQDKFLENMELDFSITLWERRFRVNAFMWIKGHAMVFRPIVTEVPDFDELWLPSVIKRFAYKRSWLVLITWAVGTWKSTTMISLVNEINNNESKHIITVEDPIEYMFTNKKSLIEQREVWTNTLSFENALKYSLRQASDVIMIWEMRDLETFRLALRAAETWNLVFATLHTSGAARTVARVIDMFPADEKEQIKAQLSESLIWVVWQKLIKRNDEWWRIPAVEIMINTTSISNTIRKWDNHQLDWIIETSSKDGMISMRRYLDRLKEKWIISEERYNEELNIIWNEL